MTLYDRLRGEEFCTWKERIPAAQEVVLGGDRFLLTVPPATSWKWFYDKVISDEISGPTTQNMEEHFVSFIHHEHLICYKAFQHIGPDNKEQSVQLGHNSGHENTGNHLFINEQSLQLLYQDLLFRPCLLPLTREGKIDETFCARPGEVFTGGYLQLESTIDITVYGRPDEDPGYAPFIGGHVKKVTIVDEPDNMDDLVNGKEPLQWWYVDGCLICTNNMLISDVCQLYNLNLLPRYPYIKK